MEKRSIHVAFSTTHKIPESNNIIATKPYATVTSGGSFAIGRSFRMTLTVRRISQVRNGPNSCIHSRKIPYSIVAEIAPMSSLLTS